MKKRIEYFQKAVDLVHGPYLADVDANWAAQERERLGLAYISALEELAQLYLDANQAPPVSFNLPACLDQNRFHEVIYQMEMRAYAALGDRASIVRRYQASKAALEEGFGISLLKKRNLLSRTDRLRVILDMINS